VPGSQPNPAVDAYIATLPPWQREVAETVRRLVHEADPDVEEVIKRRIQPYFVLDGNICALLGAKDHLNVFIYDPIAPDPSGLVNQGQANATARGIQVRRGDEIDEAALVDLFRAVIANNRAGGWRRVRSAGGAHEGASKPDEIRDRMG
jgi:hypothetical protein